jgi:hypothetical protein
MSSDEATWQAHSESVANPIGLGKTSSLTLAADLIWHF